jgi:hypothetical protein
MTRRLLLLLAAAVLASFAFSVAPTGAQRGTDLIADLSGENQVDEGDPDGTGEFTANLRRRRICYDLEFTVTGEPLDAHIHRGQEDEDGPIVVPLRPEFTEDGAESKCVRVRRRVARRIRRDPEDYYVNVHTDDFPDGAIRGQLEEETR